MLEKDFKMIHKYIRKIIDSKSALSTKELPKFKPEGISSRLNCDIAIYMSDNQEEFSLLYRGVELCVLSVPPNKTVVAVAKGEIAHLFIRACELLKRKSILIQPKDDKSNLSSKLTKIIKVRASQAEAYSIVCNRFKSSKYSIVDLSDHHDSIAGNGTVALDIIFSQAEPIDAIFVPSVEYTMVAGIAVMIKYLRPEIKVIAVEHERRPILSQALNNNSIVDKQTGKGEGVLGELAFELARQYVDSVQVICDTDIADAKKELLKEYPEFKDSFNESSFIGVSGILKHQKNEYSCISRGEGLAITLASLNGKVLTEENNHENSIFKYLEFPETQYQACLGALSYISEVLKKKHPSLKCSVKIEQQENIIRLIITSQSGKIKIIEKTLDEYARIFSGEVSIDDFFQNETDRREARFKINLLRLEAQHSKELQAAKDESISLLQNQVIGLEKSITQKDEVISLFIDGIKSERQSNIQLVKSLGSLLSDNHAAIKPLERIEKILNEGRLERHEIEIKEDLKKIGSVSPETLTDLNKLIENSMYGVSANTLTLWIQQVAIMLI